MSDEDADRDGAALLAAVDGVTVLPYSPDRPEVACAGDVLVAPYHRARRAISVLQRHPEIRHVQLLSSGRDRWTPHLRPGVSLGTASGAHAGPVSEWVLSAVLLLLRRWPELLRHQAAERWAHDTGAADTLSGKHALVIGAGAIGTATAASLVVYPLAAADSIALGLGLTLVGLCFTGTALVAAQVSASARTCYGLAGLVIGASYALRAVGDVSAPALTWVSPIGWYQGMHAFSGVRWWPALLLVGATALTLTLASALLQQRDIGAGLRAARPGPARAGQLLSSPLGLVWRLQRPTVLGWTAGLWLTGLAYGTIGDDVESLLGDNETTVELMTQGLADPVAGFYATALLMLALITSGFAISSALRPRAEEEAGHAELLLATAVPRRRWLASYVVVTVGGVLLVLAAGGLGTGIGYALVTGDGGAVLEYVVPALAYAPPVLVLSALARLVHGVLPRLGVLAWLPLIGAVVVMLLGPVLRMPGWVQGFSPFHHLPAIPAEDVSVGVTLALLAVATLVSFVGQFAFWRRDIG